MILVIWMIGNIWFSLDYPVGFFTTIFRRLYYGVVSRLWPPTPGLSSCRDPSALRRVKTNFPLVEWTDPVRKTRGASLHFCGRKMPKPLHLTYSKRHSAPVFFQSGDCPEWSVFFVQERLCVFLYIYDAFFLYIRFVVTHRRFACIYTVYIGPYI